MGQSSRRNVPVELLEVAFSLTLETSLSSIMRAGLVTTVLGCQPRPSFWRGNTQQCSVRYVTRSCVCEVTHVLAYFSRKLMDCLRPSLDAAEPCHRAALRA